MKVCIIGASGKLGQYMLRHCLERGYEVNAVCRSQSVSKLDAFSNKVTIFPGQTDDREIIKKAVEDCDAVLTVLVPWGVKNYASGTAQAVLDFARKEARLIFSCGWHISKDGKDKYSWQIKFLVPVIAFIAKLFRLVDISDQERACAKIFASDKKWTVVRASDLEEGESEGLPIWREHVGDPDLAKNRTRRIDFALFMVEAMTNNELIQKAPAIVSCK
ncbi:NAD(P)-dependent oxidoreductase [Halobacteriovorax sp. GFR7]|uniref:NAD(P)-dependent oxidoreductase n=1 Tax=unclassified Halobacteriovorax TaxID=2639665 RepID=UPI003D976CFD